MNNNFLEVSEQSPFEISKNKPDAPKVKPAISKVEPSKALDRAKMFLAFVESNPQAVPVNLENEDADEEEGQVITLNLGMAPEEALPPELFRYEDAAK